MLASCPLLRAELHQPPSYRRFAKYLDIGLILIRYLTFTSVYSFSVLKFGWNYKSEIQKKTVGK